MRHKGLDEAREKRGPRIMIWGPHDTEDAFRETLQEGVRVTPSSRRPPLHYSYLVPSYHWSENVSYVMPENSQVL